MLGDIFGVTKPAVAMIQLHPLPGSHRYNGESLQSIIDAALFEARELVAAGFDGFQLQNMGDNPSKRHVGVETVAYMTTVALALRREFSDVPLSILANWDVEASIAIADASNAAFIRVEHTYTGVSVTSWGLSEACCYEATQFQRKIGARAWIFADVYEPHAVPLAPQPVAKAARAAIEEGGAHGLYITGTSFAESMKQLQEVRRALPNVPLFLGGGTNDRNVAEALTIADGVTVASWIKGGNMQNPVDPDLAKAFMQAVWRARGSK